jgi:hypothetical protein
MRLELLPDDHGEEISFTLTRIAPDGSREVLETMEAGTLLAGTAPRRYMFVYQDLPKDSEYELMVRDTGNNGICCDAGSGEILVFELDNVTGEEMDMILSPSGDYGAELVSTFPFPSATAAVLAGYQPGR